MQILEPWQTVDREHQDRKARLARLSTLNGIEPPQIDESYIPRFQHGLKDYPVDIPVARVVFRDSVFFDAGSTELKPEADAVLNVIAESMGKDPPDVTLFVAGHTDGVGPSDVNLDLGLKRAKAVVTSLIQKKGLAHARLFVVSFGKAVPLESNDTEEGRAKNRRVEFLIAAQPEPIAAWLARQREGACLPARIGAVDACPTEFTATQVRLASRPPPKPQPPGEGTGAPQPSGPGSGGSAAVAAANAGRGGTAVPQQPAPGESTESGEAVSPEVAAAHARRAGSAVPPQPARPPAAKQPPAARPPASVSRPVQPPAEDTAQPPSASAAAGKPGSKAHAQGDASDAPPLEDQGKFKIDLKTQKFKVQPPE